MVCSSATLVPFPLPLSTCLACAVLCFFPAVCVVFLRFVWSYTGCALSFSSACSRSHPAVPESSFEPLLDKYAVLLARGSTRFNNHTRDRAVPLGRHHRQGIVLPIAVSPNGGPVNFTVGTTAGCSSMMPLANARAAAAAWCGSQLETRRVPSISLPTAIGLLGDTLPISFLKIDAQGADFELIRVTPPALLRSRVSLIGMEARSPTCPPLYQGQATCDVVAKYMRSIGFRSRGAACPVGRNMTTGACLRPMPQHNSTSVYFEMASYLCCERNAYYERI